YARSGHPVGHVTSSRLRPQLSAHRLQQQRVGTGAIAVFDHLPRLFRPSEEEEGGGACRAENGEMRAIHLDTGGYESIFEAAHPQKRHRPRLAEKGVLPTVVQTDVGQPDKLLIPSHAGEKLGTKEVGLTKARTSIENLVDRSQGLLFSFLCSHHQGAEEEDLRALVREAIEDLPRLSDLLVLHEFARDLE